MLESPIQGATACTAYICGHTSCLMHLHVWLPGYRMQHYVTVQIMTYTVPV